MAKKPVLVQLTDELIERLDRLGEVLDRSRSAMVRDALERYVAENSEAEKDRRLIEGYRRYPDTGELDRWNTAGLERMVAEEPW